MLRSAILSLGLAAFALGVVGCGGGSSSTLSQEEQKKKSDKVKEDMMNLKNKANPAAPQ